MNASWTRLSFGGALLLSCASGCYTTTHVVTLTPVKTSYPVSATGQYLDARLLPRP